MKEIFSEELKQLQLSILDYVDAFCRRNNVFYTMSGGTLLGAVRHKGFIPWDDDIDIQMLRDEYSRFIDLWQKEKNHPFELISIESGNNAGYAFAKVCNPNTLTVVDGVVRPGVFLDVFPVDKVKNEKDFRRRHMRIKHLYKRANGAFILQKAKTKKISMWEYVRAFVLSLGVDRNYWAKQINKLAQKYNGTNSILVFEMISGMKCKRPMPIKIFTEYIDLPFENRMYMAVKDYDCYLSSTFGDYMKLPPIEQRVKVHGFIPYWK